jgi:hypothetical protein
LSIGANAEKMRGNQLMEFVLWISKKWEKELMLLRNETPDHYEKRERTLELAIARKGDVTIAKSSGDLMQCTKSSILYLSEKKKNC